MTKKFTRYDYRISGNYFVGNHDVKAGFMFERVDANVFRDYSGGQFVTILPAYETDPLQRPVYFHSFFASPAATIDDATMAPVIATPQNDNFAVFLQDSWSILNNLTLNAGVRWEKEDIRGLDDVTYINVDHFSPRVGITWDPWNDGRTKIGASYSQFVPIIPLDMNIRSFNAERDGATYNFDPIDLNCNSEAESEDNSCVIRGDGCGCRRSEHQARPTPTRSSSASSGRSAERGRWACAASTGACGASSRTRASRRTPATTTRFFNPGFSRDRVPGNDCQPVPRSLRRGGTSSGIELTAQKRLSDHWMVYASYLYGTLQGNYDGAFRAIGGFFAKDPNITDDFDYPEFQVNAYGKLTLDRRHQAKLQAATSSPSG